MTGSAGPVWLALLSRQPARVRIALIRAPRMTAGARAADIVRSEAMTARYRRTRVDAGRAGSDFGGSGAARPATADGAG